MASSNIILYKFHYKDNSEACNIHFVIYIKPSTNNNWYDVVITELQFIIIEL